MNKLKRALYRLLGFLLAPLYALERRHLIAMVPKEAPLGWRLHPARYGVGYVMGSWRGLFVTIAVVPDQVTTRPTLFFSTSRKLGEQRATGPQREHAVNTFLKKHKGSLKPKGNGWHVAGHGAHLLFRFRWIPTL